LGFKQVQVDLHNLIRDKNCSVVDVRSPEEFRGGHAEGSVNIPLQEIQRRVDEIRNLKTPVVLCCASGGRSGQANAWLRSVGVDCHNIGSWLDVNYIQSQK
jgi:rhodanese-related sulfurtransferase